MGSWPCWTPATPRRTSCARACCCGPARCVAAAAAPATAATAVATSRCRTPTQPREALGCLLSAVARAPAAPAPLLCKGRTLLLLGRAAEAVAVLRELCLRHPRAPHLCLLSQALIAAGDLPAARSALQQSVREDASGDATLMARQARCWEQLGEYEEAAALYSRALALRPQLAAALLGRGMCRNVIFARLRERAIAQERAGGAGSGSAGVNATSRDGTAGSRRPSVSAAPAARTASSLGEGGSAAGSRRQSEAQAHLQTGWSDFTACLAAHPDHVDALLARGACQSRLCVAPRVATRSCAHRLPLLPRSPPDSRSVGAARPRVGRSDGLHHRADHLPGLPSRAAQPRRALRAHAQLCACH